MPYPPTIRKVNPADTPILVLALTSDYAAADHGRRLRRKHPAAEDFADPGVGLVGIGGQQKPAIRVQVDPQALATAASASKTCATCSARPMSICRKARSTARGKAYTLNTNDQLLKPDAYNNLIVAYRNGSPVRISDVGKAIEGPENDLLAGWFNKQRAIILADPARSPAPT